MMLLDRGCTMSPSRHGTNLRSFRSAHDGQDMFGRFTNHAQAAVNLAREEEMRKQARCED